MSCCAVLRPTSSAALDECNTRVPPCFGVSVSFKREVAMLRGTTALEQEIDPGSPVRIKLDLVPYLGKPETKVIEVPVPADYAGKEVEVELSPGYDVDRPKPSIENVSDLVTSLKNPTFPEQSLVATIRLQGEGGASFKGQLATRMPPRPRPMST